MSHVVIIGGGFVGLNAAKGLGGKPNIEVTLIDRTNYHLFQPLLYQVAMAGLSPADIAAPIRSILSQYRNIRVLQGEVQALDLSRKRVIADFGESGHALLPGRAQGDFGAFAKPRDAISSTSGWAVRRFRCACQSFRFS